MDLLKRMWEERRERMEIGDGEGGESRGGEDEVRRG